MNTFNVRIAAAVALALAGVPGFAAEADQLEEVQVTGSRILQAPGMETPTPVTSVQIEELEALSPGNLIDSLSTLPVFFNNSTVDSMLGGQNSGGANVNLRGAGANRTLVLLDGRRVVSSNRFGSVDVNTLPDMLLQNVETVTGGASASYGTDAVAGVVNFKLDKDFEGVKVKGQGGRTSRHDGDNWEYGLAFGHKFGERLHFVGSFQKANTDPIDTLDSLQSRPWMNQASRVTNPAGTGANPTGPTFLRRNYVAPTNYTTTGIFLDAGPLNRLQFDGTGTSLSPLPFYGVGARDNGCLCQALPSQDYGISVDDQIAAGYKRENGFAHLTFALNDNVNLYAEGVWGDSANDTRRESISLLSIWQGRIYSNNAFLSPDLQARILAGAPASTATTDNTTGVVQNVRAATFGVFLPNNADNPIGDTRQITRNRMSNYTVGFEAKIPGGALEGWNVNGYLQKGKNRQDFNTVNGIRVDRLWLALDAVRDASGNIVCRAALPQYDPNGYLKGCAPLNLFGGVRNITPEAAAWVRDPLKVASQWIDLKTAELSMSGSLGFGLPAGDISTAVGASYRKETLDQYTVDPADEFPALPDGRLFSDLGLAPASLRGLVPQGIAQFAAESAKRRSRRRFGYWWRRGVPRRQGRDVSPGERRRRKRVGVVAVGRMAGVPGVFEVRRQFIDDRRREHQASLVDVSPDPLLPVVHRVLLGEADPGDAAERLHELLPLVALPPEYRRARGRELVVATAPLARAFHPAALQPAAFFELVQRRVERREVVAERAVGVFLDAGGQLVAVARRLFEQRQDHELRAAFLRFAEDVGGGGR